MAIVKRATGDGKARYMVRIAVRDADGRRQNRTIGTYATKREAERAEREALIQTRARHAPEAGHDHGRGTAG